MCHKLFPSTRPIDATLLSSAPLVRNIATQMITGSRRRTSGSTSDWHSVSKFRPFVWTSFDRACWCDDATTKSPSSHFLLSMRPNFASPVPTSPSLARAEKCNIGILLPLPNNDGLSYHLIDSIFLRSTSTRQTTFDKTSGLSALRKSFPSRPAATFIPRNETHEK